MKRFTAPRPVELPTEDGVTLRGHVLGEGERWVVLVHDAGADLDCWGPLARALAEAGSCVLAFDLRGHGASDDPVDPSIAHVDVAAAFRFAREQGATRLLGVGAGIGATALLVAAGAKPAPAAIVLLSPAEPPDGLDPDAVRVARMPKLFVTGSLDPAAETTRRLMRRTIGPAMAESPPVPERGSDLLGSAWGAHVLEHVVLFLGRSGAFA